jgi:AcrR family transcriptional regulator
MPPKARITREMIIEAGLKIVRTEGDDSLNVRAVAAVLECSTQPVMYHFKTVSDLKSAVYDAANALHTEYIMTPDASTDNPFLSIGLRYIRFAAEEKHLFRFLFQSDSFQNVSFGDLMNAEELSPMIAPLCAAADLTEAQARAVFEMLFICVHGAASLIANNSICYDRPHFEEMLRRAFDGAVAALKGEA